MLEIRPTLTGNKEESAIDADVKRSSRMLPLNIQLFAHSSDDGASNSDDDNTEDGTIGNTDGETSTKGNTGDNGKEGDNNDLESRIEKLAQSRADKMLENERKKSATMKKELDELRKKNMTAEELRQAEIQDRENKIAEREKEIAQRENRLFAVKAMKKAGLDDGSDTVLELLDLVVANGDNEESITNKANALSKLINTMVKAETERIFKENGRTPDGTSGSGGGQKDDDNIAVQLGKRRAEQDKKSTDVLNAYIGGKK